MGFTLRALTGTGNHVVVRRASKSLVAQLVAEIVQMPDGYTIYRMDVTGVLGSGFGSPTEALAFFESWVSETHPSLEGVGF